jgi:hypothetical protein
MVRCWSGDGPVMVRCGGPPTFCTFNAISSKVLSQDHHEITTPSSNPTMSSTRPSGFRRPCFNGSSQDGHNSSHKPLQLTYFTKTSHRRLRLPPSHDEDEHDGDVDNSNCFAQRMNAEAEKRKDELGMERCIPLLEPHLAAYREKCSAQNHTTNTTNATIESNNEDQVPSQLLRVAQFFTWRWTPIKKALLRPPPNNSESEQDQEVEIGMTSDSVLRRPVGKRTIGSC